MPFLQHGERAHVIVDDQPQDAARLERQRMNLNAFGRELATHRRERAGTVRKAQSQLWTRGHVRGAYQTAGV